MRPSGTPVAVIAKARSVGGGLKQSRDVCRRRDTCPRLKPIRPQTGYHLFVPRTGQRGGSVAKRVFFSFHYQDVIDFRANVVRQHWLTKPDRDTAGFFDASIWETAKRSGSLAVKRVIHAGLDGTSVTCVLVGSQTYLRPWVRYEILKSFRKGNRLLAVHINSIRAKDQSVKPLGPNPLKSVGITFSATGQTATLWEKGNGGWSEYTEIDGSASYQTGGVDQQYWGKGFNLGQWYREYDWVTHDGYNNFASWVA